MAVEYLGPFNPVRPIARVARGPVRIIDTGVPNLPVDWALEERRTFVAHPADPVALTLRARRIERFVSRVSTLFAVGTLLGSGWVWLMHGVQ